MRAIIWTVVGLLLVAAVAIFIYMRSQDKRVSQAAQPTAADVKSDAERLAKKADEYTAEVKKLRETLGAQAAEAKKVQLTKLDSLVGQIKLQAGKLVGQAGDQLKAARRTLNDLQQEYSRIKHELELAPAK